MIITILYNENNGCDYHRLLLPAEKFVLENGDIVKLVRHADLHKDYNLLNSHIVMYSRLFFNDLNRLNYYKEKFGFKIVVDFDDHYKLSYNHILNSQWKEHKVQEQMIRNCNNADLVLVTNSQLQKVYKEYNQNVEIVPNAIPINEGQFVSKPTEDEKIRFGYAGGSTHYYDIRTLNGLFLKLKSDSEFKSKCKFILAGYNNTTSNRTTWDKIESIVKIPNVYERRGSLPLTTYMEHYNYMDIAIAPLEDNTFNNNKSNLKFIEAATMKKPFISANILPYTIDKNNKGIKFCNKTSEWYDAFKFFIKNPQAIEDYGNINFEYVKEHYNLENINKLRLDLIRNLV